MLPSPVRCFPSSGSLFLLRKVATKFCFSELQGRESTPRGEILCLSALSGGLHATLKSDYPITVLRGHSICETVLSSDPINYTGIKKPDVVVALSQEGVNRRKPLFAQLDEDTTVLAADDISLPETDGSVIIMDFKTAGISNADRARLPLLPLSLP